MSYSIDVVSIFAKWADHNTLLAGVVGGGTHHSTSVLGGVWQLLYQEQR